MITEQRFAAIDNEIKTAINESFINLKENHAENYILFLADADYYPDFKGNPFIIDSRMDYLRDESRLTFLVDFLKLSYSFPANQKEIDDNEFRLHLELMIYTHIWESKAFLKKLYRLAHISNGEEYSWKVKVPEMSKHEFIRTDIRGVFEKKSNQIGHIIKKGFHTSLRNAFAHAEYSFDTMNHNRKIILHKKDPANWELKEITFDDWSERFVYSILLSYYLLKITFEKRQAIVGDFNQDTFSIKHPKEQGGFTNVEIKYDKDNGFSFKR